MAFIPAKPEIPFDLNLSTRRDGSVDRLEARLLGRTGGRPLLHLTLSLEEDQPVVASVVDEKLIPWIRRELGLSESGPAVNDEASQT